MNAVAHSSLSRVLIEANASSTSAGSRPIIGYIPVCARLMASTLISSMVRSALRCANAAGGTSTVKAIRTNGVSRRFLGVCRLHMRVTSICLGMLPASRAADTRIGGVPPSRSTLPAGESLESEFYSQLNCATAARTDDGVRSRHVGSSAGATKAPGTGHGRIVVAPSVLSAKGIREIGMVEEIEEFPAELKSISLAKCPVFHHREIHIAESK